MPTHVVRSVEEVRQVIGQVDLSEEQYFLLGDDTPLHEARMIWSVVSDTGGYGQLSNVEVLDGKEVALGFVTQKLAELRRLVDKSDLKLESLVDSVDHLEAILAAGGPGVPPGYEPQAFQGVFTSYVDTDQAIAEEHMEQHVHMMKALLIGAQSPGSPAPEGYHGAQLLSAREAMEQRALAQLNSDILKLKRDALANLRNTITHGITDLEARYVHDPTNLGCGTGDYSRFVDLPMLPAERKGQTW